MNNTLNIILHIYFAINFFIAGVDNNSRHPFRTKSEYFTAFFYAIFFSVFGIAFYAITLIISSIKAIYIRTYLHYGITILRTWYRFAYKRREMKLNGYQLNAFKKNIMINRMPGVWKNWWMTFLDGEIDKKKKELFEKHGEVTDFKC